jgi:epoxyqueuosine reductase
MNSLDQKIFLPEGNQLLLHTCCAPCSAWIIEQLVASKIEVTLFFYNPNIHFRDEYDRRKNEVIRFANKMKVPWIEGDYDVQNWKDCTRGMESYPERSERCMKCFLLRLRKTARQADATGFKIFSTSLSISRWKDINQVTNAGRTAATENNLVYFEHNWRKSKGEEKAVQVTKREKFYRQKYCGCVYSRSRSSSSTSCSTSNEKVT